MDVLDSRFIREYVVLTVTTFILRESISQGEQTLTSDAERSPDLEIRLQMKME